MNEIERKIRPARLVEIVTKCGIALVEPERPHYSIKHYDTSAAHIQASVERSLSHLRTESSD